MVQINSLTYGLNYWHLADDIIMAFSRNVCLCLNLTFADGSIDNQSALLWQWSGIEKATRHYLN